jgi:ribosomal protein S18 acetylase RimI-like enzyme
MLKKIAEYLILFFQSVPFCRKLLKKLFRNAFEYRQVVSEEDRRKLINFYNPEMTSESQECPTGLKPPLSALCSFMVLFRGRIIGAVHLAKNEFNNNYAGWWLYSMQVYWPFRRLGIGERLTKEVFSFAIKNRIELLYVSVWDKNKSSCSLYENLGFVKIAEMPVSFSNEVETRKYIVMKKELTH